MDKKRENSSLLQKKKSKQSINVPTTGKFSILYLIHCESGPETIVRKEDCQSAPRRKRECSWFPFMKKKENISNTYLPNFLRSRVGTLITKKKGEGLAQFGHKKKRQAFLFTGKKSSRALSTGT